MKLLVCTNTYPPLAMGGYELLCEEHVAWLRERGHDVTVLTTSWGLPRGGPRDEVGRGGETVVRKLDLHWKNFQHQPPNLLVVWSHERRQRRIAERLLDQVQPDACIAWGMGAVSKSVLVVIDQRHVPMLTVIGEHWPIWDVSGDRWLRMWSRAPMRWLRPLASAAIAPTSADAMMRSIIPLYASEYMQRVIEDAVPAWSGRGAVVLNGIQVERFLSASREERLGSPVRMLYAGRIERRKGAQTAVDAVAELRRSGIDATLTLLGWRDEGYAAEVRESAANLGVDAEVSWSEPVDRDEMPRVYSEHDVLVFPALWDEPFGLVPLEAMASGCLVVATGTGGSAEYLRDEANALLFPRGNGVALAGAVRRLASDPDLVGRLRKDGFATAAAHSFETYARAIESWVVDVVDRRNDGVPQSHETPGTGLNAADG